MVHIGDNLILESMKLAMLIYSAETETGVELHLVESINVIMSSVTWDIGGPWQITIYTIF